MSKLRLAYPTFRQPKTVTFGVGSRKSLASLESLDGTAFFLTGQSHIQEEVRKALGQRIKGARTIVKPLGEPTQEMLNIGANFLLSRPCERIVGIGGGSVLDWCRLSWAQSSDLLTQESGTSIAVREPLERPEIWLIPTTCASGAEGASVAVYSDSEGIKVPVVSSHFLADQVVLDGHFLRSLDETAIANSLGDALSHAIESFLSIVPSKLAEDAALSALRRIFTGFQEHSLSCRHQNLLEGAHLAGIAAANASVGIVHAFAHAVSLSGVAHGHGNALGLCPGIRLNADVPAMRRLLDHLCLSDVDELCERVETVLKDAWHRDDASLVARLMDASSRRTITARMMQDVCLRTNPRRIDEDSVTVFLDDVVRSIHSR